MDEVIGYARSRRQNIEIIRQQDEPDNHGEHSLRAERGRAQLIYMEKGHG